MSSYYIFITSYRNINMTVSDNENETIYSILVFDDGNEKYESLPNVWRILKTSNGKSTIINEKEKVIINSISRWKLLCQV